MTEQLENDFQKIVSRLYIVDMCLVKLSPIYTLVYISPLCPVLLLAVKRVYLYLFEIINSIL